MGARSFSSRAQSQEWTKSGALFQATFPHRLSYSRSFSTSRDKESSHLLSPQVDTVFMDFFCDTGSKEILESFINVFLDLHGDDKIEIEEFLDPSKIRLEIGKPTAFFDVSVKNISGERYIVEMQVYNYKGAEKYLFDSIMHGDTNRTKESLKNYDSSLHMLPKVHVIALASYGILKSDATVETFRFQSQKSESNGQLFDKWRATIIDLTNFNTGSFENVESERDQWLFLIKNADNLNQQQVKAMKQCSIFKTALERFEILSPSSEKKKEYEQSINAIRDWDAVLEYADKTGREEGERLKALEITEKLIELDIPIEKIVKSTGLTHKEVEELQKKLS